MKIDRLLGITFFLLNRGTVSAAALAERFEVSRRTIQRDMEALSLAGIPVVSTFGTDGGYRIEDGFKLAKQLGGREDYQNILTALRGLYSAYGSRPVGDTLSKALAALGDNAPHVFVDFGVAREGEDINRLLRTLDAAIQAHTPLRLCYVNAEGGCSERVVEPLALSFQWYAWYLFAYCTQRQAYRLFKLPRIASVSPAAGQFCKEHGDVEALMRQQQATDTRSYLSIRVLCKAQIRQQALEYLGRDIVETRENGDFVLALHVPWERMWFSILMGFGDQVEVLSPEAVRQRLRQRAQEIAGLYG